MTSAMTGWKHLRNIPTYIGDAQAASEARKAAEEALIIEQQKRLSTVVVADRMRQLREHNHFADKIAETMRKT